MCRLYGFRANEPTKVECSLVYAQNALLRQSRADLRGRSHSDGWGISFYENTHPEIERRDTAAHSDAFFSVTAERVYARTVVAHVRAATVGAHSLENTHPFVYGHWSFAHNGTLRGFDAVRAELEAEIDTELLALRAGVTDSETAFYWLLSRLRRASISLDQPVKETRPLVDVLIDAIKCLDPLCRRADPERPAQLNFMLTNGEIMLASRWRNSLYWIRREGIHDCEICGIPHVHHSDTTDYHAVAVASEPITHERWEAVPEASVVEIDAALRAHLHYI